MKTFARVEWVADGLAIVREIFQAPELPNWHPDIVKLLIEIDPSAGIGMKWRYDGKTFSAPPPIVIKPIVDVNDLASLLIAKGIVQASDVDGIKK